MSNLSKMLTLNFVDDYPKSAAELHKQIQEEIEPDTNLQEVQAHLAELASDNFIINAKNLKGIEKYWR